MACGAEAKATSSAPGWVQKAGKKDIWQKAKGFDARGYKDFKKERVEPFTADQNTGFGMVRDFASDPTSKNWITQAGGVYSDVANLKPPSLADIQPYMDPYLEGVLDPTLRAIREASDAERLRIGDMATRSNAFGDFRHGVLESKNASNTAVNLGDATAAGYSSAWANALAQRDNDIVRRLTGAQALEGAAGNIDAATMRQIESILGSGAAQQQYGQNVNDAKFQQWGMKRQDEYDKISMLIAALNGVPYNRTTTSTSSPGLAGTVGSVVGGIAGGVFR